MQLTKEEVQTLDEFLSSNGPLRAALERYCEGMALDATKDCARSLRGAGASATSAQKHSTRAEVFEDFFKLLQDRLSPSSSGPTA